MKASSPIGSISCFLTKRILISLSLGAITVLSNDLQFVLTFLNAPASLFDEKSRLCHSYTYPSLQFNLFVKSHLLFFNLINLITNFNCCVSLISFY